MCTLLYVPGSPDFKSWGGLVTCPKSRSKVTKVHRTDKCLQENHIQFLNSLSHSHPTLSHKWFIFIFLDGNEIKSGGKEQFMKGILERKLFSAGGESNNIEHVCMDGERYVSAGRRGESTFTSTFSSLSVKHIHKREKRFHFHHWDSPLPLRAWYLQNAETRIYV